MAKSEGKGRGPQVKGYDYRTNKAVSMTPAEWRKAFPPEQYVRATTGAKGETWYRWRRADGHAGELVAEAYAVVPA
jgi:hypothetical protein